MNGIFWITLGTAIGLASPFLFRWWQRRAADRDESPPTATRPVPSAASSGRAPAPVRGPSPAAPGPNRALNRKLTRKFHGVSIKPGRSACAAMDALLGQRFLPDEAPSLPLAACDAQKCQCAYSHHGDRREQEDRRSGWGTFGGFTPSVPGGNRRAKRRERRAKAST